MKLKIRGEDRVFLFGLNVFSLWGLIYWIFKFISIFELILVIKVVRFMSIYVYLWVMIY